MELQNEELLRVRGELEETLERISDLFDFAPVGYLTLDRAGVIREANLAASIILGVARSGLANRLLGRFVVPKSRRVFDDFLMRVFTNQSREACEVALVVEGKPVLEVKLEAVASDSGTSVQGGADRPHRAQTDRGGSARAQQAGVHGHPGRRHRPRFQQPAHRADPEPRSGVDARSPPRENWPVAWRTPRRPPSWPGGSPSNC
ncbi:MAG: PAS domain-containing protein [Opitutaceae bacterium]|nr:PAS domain-containing protein [Opitutaceae bacterium]